MDKIKEFLQHLNMSDVENLKIEKISSDRIFPLQEGKVIDHSWAGELGTKIFYNFITDSEILLYHSYIREFSENGRFGGIRSPEPFNNWLKEKNFNQLYGFLIERLENHSYEEDFQETKILFVLDTPISKAELENLYNQHKEKLIVEKLSVK